MNDRRTAWSRGRPILGLISGLLLGIFLAVDLLLAGVVPLDSVALYIIPAAGLVGGLALGWWAPVRLSRG
jgi:hypothetical protein